MMRLVELEANECPKFLSERPTEKSHAVCFSDESLVIPLQLKDTMSYIPTRSPSANELNGDVRIHRNIGFSNCT